MNNEVQRTVATGKFTLPVVCIISALLWMIVSEIPFLSDTPLPYDGTGTLWETVPEALTRGMTGKAAGLALTAVAVYMTAELNNINVLLRVSSRLISSLLAVLCTISTFAHSLQPAHVVLVLTVVSYFAIFATYQNPDPVPTYLAYLSLGLSSLAFPKMALLCPVVWMVQANFRSLTPRTLCASLLGLATPYWFFASASFITGNFGLFLSHVADMTAFDIPDYSTLSAKQIAVYALALTMFVIGVVDFYQNSYLDKTRTRLIYSAVIFMGFVSFALPALVPGGFNTLLAPALINTSIVAGHNLALTYNKFTLVYTIAAAVLALATFAL